MIRYIRLDTVVGYLQKAPLSLSTNLTSIQLGRGNKLKHMSFDSNTRQPRSWGRYPRVEHSQVQSVYWRSEIPDLAHFEQPLLPYAYGRSYGDSCLNEGGVSLDVSHLRRFISFDEEEGLLCCEAGVSLAEILELVVPRGWFIPVSPGTRFVSVGGAIANDVHGKNHHRAGTFGCHVKQITLYRSDNDPVVCSPAVNSDLFQATIAGLGLTGVIGSAEIQLKRIGGNAIDVETLAFRNLDHFVELSAASDQNHEYTVAWVDCLSGTETRGIFFRGNHAEKNVSYRSIKTKIPFPFPEFVLSRPALELFNRAYFTLKARNPGFAIVHYDPSCLPLVSVP